MGQIAEKFSSEDPFDPLAPGLSDQERRFADHYAQHLNMAAAARYAGIPSEVSGPAGARIAQRPRVRAYLAQILQARNYAEGLDRDRVLSELVTLGMTNMVDYITPSPVDGSPMFDWSKVEANPRLGAAIKKITTRVRVVGTGDDAREVTETQVELHDKLSALEKLCKHLGIIDDAKALGRGLGEGLGAAVAAMSERDLARRIAFVLATGLRSDAAEPIDVTPVAAGASVDEFADLT